MDKQENVFLFASNWSTSNVLFVCPRNERGCLKGIWSHLYDAVCLYLCASSGSGAGKSTFLNVLSGRTNLGQMSVSGQLGLGGFKFPARDQDIIRSVCTYVPQSDILCPTQTVEEALMFYARLKLPALPLEQQEKRVNYLIDILKLNKCRHTPIGGESKRGVSGGEKRRVSIAAEILNDTDIIFLDEPTSGLDAYTAARAIKTLKEFCSVSNKIIIATIHQPAMEVFYLFDKLILLSSGRCCFNSKLTDINVHFRNQLRPKTNPADVILFEVQRDPDRWSADWIDSALNDNKWSVKRMTRYPLLSFEDVKNGDKIQISTNIAMAPMVRHIHGRCTVS